MKNFIKKYPWLRIHSESIEDYIPPDYYDKLLKDYTFSGRSDLNFFETYIFDNVDKRLDNVLELGPGSERVTDVLINSSINYKGLDLVDLSGDMIQKLEDKYNKNKKITFIKKDSLDYLEESKNKYDLVYSLWSFSHSVHQHIIERNEKYLKIEEIIKYFIINNMSSGAKFFLIHFDSQSDEQKILMKQWKKYFSIFDDKGNQSPSKQIIDKALLDLNGKIIKNFTCKHLVGNPITYGTLSEALEIFMNFHMETEFNKHKDTEIILSELSEDIEKYKDNDGKYHIRPGCFIYSFERA